MSICLRIVVDLDVVQSCSGFLSICLRIVVDLDVVQPCPIRLAPKRTLKVNGIVNGIAQLRDMLFVVCDGQNTIFIFQLSDTTASDQVTVDELKNPSDIAADELNECIYITDEHSMCVWKLDVSNLPRTAKKCWQIEKHLYTLYAGSGITLLLTKINGNKISAFDNHGRCHQIKLFKNTEAMHAVQKLNGNVIVTYKTRIFGGSDEDVQWFVSEYNVTQTEINFSGPQSGPVRYNKYMTVIREGNVDIAILLADGDTNTVFCLGPTLRINDYSNSQLIKLPHPPNRILYIEKFKELMIGQRNGTVSVYSVNCSDTYHETDTSYV